MCSIPLLYHVAGILAFSFAAKGKRSLTEDAHSPRLVAFAAVREIEFQAMAKPFVSDFLQPILGLDLERTPGSCLIRNPE